MKAAILYPDVVTRPGAKRTLRYTAALVALRLAKPSLRLVPALLS